MHAITLLRTLNYASLVRLCIDALDDALQDSITVIRHASRSGSWRNALVASDVIAAMQALQAQLTLAFDTQRLAAAREVSPSPAACV